METRRLILRPWREDDAEVLFKYASDPDVGSRAGWMPHRSVEESREIISEVFSAEGMWAVELKETGEVIGCVGYQPASCSNLDIDDDQCEVGYWIAKPYWNRGLCTEALRAVVAHCFDVKGFTALWGDFFPDNPASGRVMEKCGFTDTGQEVLCPTLAVGSEKPVRVMRLGRPAARKHWMDNLRWVTVLLVLLYHVFYFYNNKGVFGGVGGFDPDPMRQPQDIVMYVLYPWFMMLLFLLAGISARYSLEKRSPKAFRRSRTLKLLVPSTIGLLAFQWTTGYFNVSCGASAPDLSQVPAVVRWLIYSVSGSGPLWFAQELWVFSLLLLLIRRLDRRGRFRRLCARASTPAILLMGVLVWAGSQCMIMNPRVESLDGLYNLYRPLAYLVPFLMGYFVFCNDGVQERVKAMRVPVAVGAVAAGAALCVTGWGTDLTAPQYLSGWLNCLYAWLMMLAMMGLFMRRFDGTSRFCGYMSRTSYDLYVLHYSVLVSFGYMLKTYTTMAPWLIYVVLTVAVFLLTPALYEVLRRIPLLRWAILGEKGHRSGRAK